MRNAVLGTRSWHLRAELLLTRWSFLGAGNLKLSSHLWGSEGFSILGSLVRGEVRRTLEPRWLLCLWLDSPHVLFIGLRIPYRWVSFIVICARQFFQNKSERWKWTRKRVRNAFLCNFKETSFEDVDWIIWRGGRLLWARKWTFGHHKLWKSSSETQQLSASLELIKIYNNMELNDQIKTGMVGGTCRKQGMHTIISM